MTDVSFRPTVEESDLWPMTKDGNRKRFTTAVHNQLRIIEECKRGQDLREGLQNTPFRVTRMWLDELTAGYEMDPDSLFATFKDHGEYDGMIVVKDIPVRSQCEHHLVPFVGY